MDTQRKVMRRKKGKEEEKEERRNIRKKYSSHTHTGQGGVNVSRLWKRSEDEQRRWTQQ